MGDWADQYDEGDMVLPTKSPDQPSAGNKELREQKLKNDIAVEVLEAASQAKYGVGFLLLDKKDQQHLVVDVGDSCKNILEIITASNQQLLRELEGQKQENRNARIEELEWAEHNADDVNFSIRERIDKLRNED